MSRQTFKTERIAVRVTPKFKRMIEFKELIEYQWEFYSKLCNKLNSEIDSDVSPFKEWPKSCNFVIGIFEEREGEEIYNQLVINSLGAEKAKALYVI